MFSKYDVYTTVQSMYCYPDTDVLINKLNIHDKAELKQAEEEFTAVKQMALLQEPIKGRFTKTHLFRIHRFLFEDVYPFAGQHFAGRFVAQIARSVPARKRHPDCCWRHRHYIHQGDPDADHRLIKIWGERECSPRYNWR